MDEHGWLKVTGRIKEQYKLENGKYVVPTPIENAMIMSRFIHQVVLVGANRPYNVALIVPEWTAIRSELEIDDSVPEEDIANNVRVQSLMEEEIRQSCGKLKKFEVPKKWAFVAPFTLANNMITQKTSVRRLKVIEAYSTTIAHMYGDDPIAPEAADGEHHHREAA
jgi:long-chain acyl-CoA synthetase